MPPLTDFDVDTLEINEGAMFAQLDPGIIPQMQWRLVLERIQQIHED